MEEQLKPHAPWTWSWHVTRDRAREKLIYFPCKCDLLVRVRHHQQVEMIFQLAPHSLHPFPQRVFWHSQKSAGVKKTNDGWVPFSILTFWELVYSTCWVPVTLPCLMGGGGGGAWNEQSIIKSCLNSGQLSCHGYRSRHVGHTTLLGNFTLHNSVAGIIWVWNVQETNPPPPHHTDTSLLTQWLLEFKLSKRAEPGQLRGLWTTYSVLSSCLSILQNSSGNWTITSGFRLWKGKQYKAYLSVSFSNILWTYSTCILAFGCWSFLWL